MDPDFSVGEQFRLQRRVVVAGSHAGKTYRKNLRSLFLRMPFRLRNVVFRLYRSGPGKQDPVGLFPLKRGNIARDHGLVHDVQHGAPIWACRKQIELRVGGQLDKQSTHIVLVIGRDFLEHFAHIVVSKSLKRKIHVEPARQSFEVVICHFQAVLINQLLGWGVELRRRVTLDDQSGNRCDTHLPPQVSGRGGLITIGIRLLQHMRQFMRQQPAASGGGRFEPATIKHNVVSHGVRIGIYIPRRLFCQGIRMHPHVREITSEPGLEKG